MQGRLNSSQASADDCGQTTVRMMLYAGGGENDDDHVDNGDDNNVSRSRARQAAVRRCTVLPSPWC